MVISGITNRSWYACMSEYTKQPSAGTFCRPAVIKPFDGV